MFSVSASNYHKPLSFKAQVNPVRYVVVDGVVTDDKTIIEEVSKQFASKLRKGNIFEQPLCDSLKKSIPEYYSYARTQPATMLKSYNMGLKFNIIVGQAAANLKRIWEQSGVAIATKKQQASNAVKKIFSTMPYQHIAIIAKTKNVKGKIKYIIQNVYKTV